MSIDKDIWDAYLSLGSINKTAKHVGCSWNRVIKSLSSSDILINDTHEIILDLCESGMTPEQIAKQVGISVKTVQAYLPRVRPVYGENLSDTAKRIRKCREKKEQNKRAE